MQKRIFILLGLLVAVLVSGCVPFSASSELSNAASLSSNNTSSATLGSFSSLGSSSDAGGGSEGASSSSSSPISSTNSSSNGTNTSSNSQAPETYLAKYVFATSDNTDPSTAVGDDASALSLFSSVEDPSGAGIVTNIWAHTAIYPNSTYGLKMGSTSTAADLIIGYSSSVKKITATFTGYKATVTPVEFAQTSVNVGSTTTSYAATEATIYPTVTSIEIKTSSAKRFYLTSLTFYGDSSSETEPTPAYTATLDSSVSSSISTTYKDGNFNDTAIGSFSYNYYRAYSLGSAGFAKLLNIPYAGSMHGSFGNNDAITGILKADLTYSMSGSSSTPATFYYGNSRVLTDSLSVPYSSSTTTTTFTFKAAQAVNYFRLVAGDDTLQIVSLSLGYLGTGSVPSTSLLSSGEGKYRINPNTYSGSLVSGSSSVSVPTSIAVSGSSYTVLASKTYTYYTFDAVQANPSLASLAAWTDPMDVANYYVAFGVEPANYALSNYYSSRYSVFGSAARKVSSAYYRTDGYVNAVPLKWNGSQPYAYYELDIDVNGYSSSNRGVGRVVVFTGGFTAAGYDSSRVAVFTDDHYASFQECYNNGSWSARFNGENLCTNYVYGAPTSLTAA